MNEIKDHTEKVYWIAYSNDLEIFHQGSLDVGNVLSTGQPILEQFSTEEEWGNRIIELKGQEYYDSLTSNDEFLIDDIFPDEEII